jgi:LPS-assembly protein
MRAERATYTNCSVGNDDWYLRMNRLDLDRTTDVGVAHNATVYFKGVPILYTPWIDFPISERRKSGFLAPTFGSTNKSGAEFALPYYWNIAPNRDYTLTPNVMSKRGILYDNEFRYLEPTYSGDLRAALLPDDRMTGDARWGYFLKHNQRFTDRLSGWVDLEGVSDSQYFIDISDKIAATSQTVLPRAAALNYNGDWWKLGLSSVRYQTLQTDPLAPVVPPYARVPQVVLDASRPNVSGFDLNFFGEADNFQSPTLVSGWRQVYYPSISLPLREPLFYVVPNVGFNYTRYTFPATTQEPQVRGLPIATVDSGMTFQRDTSIGSRDFVQTLEPRLYYVYIPFREQNQLPVYDSAQADFDITQIFYWNQFSGWDRINDANQLTAGATSRLIEPLTGVEVLRATLAQRYYFKEQLVQLNNVVPSTSRSDLLAGLTGQLTRAWSLNAGMQWGIVGGELERFNVGAHYQPQPNQIINFGYRFTRDQIRQIDLSGQWPLSRHWTVMARWDYSVLDRSLLEGLAGFEYNASCWAARMVLHRFVVGTNQWSNAVFFQLELTGLSRLGNNPFEVLRQSIGGYTKPPIRPTGGAQEYYPGMDSR